jgi:hypothetical protein
MGSLRPLRGILFAYELVRLLVLIGVFAYRGPVGESFPWLAWLVPNALFPLMALFFCVDGAAYGAYAPLYTAGKVMSVVTALGWYVFSALLYPARGDAVFFTLGENILPFLGGALFVTAGDLFSIAGGLLLTRRLKPWPPRGPGVAEPAEQSAEGGN